MSEEQAHLEEEEGSDSRLSEEAKKRIAEASEVDVPEMVVPEVPVRVAEN